MEANIDRTECGCIVLLRIESFKKRKSPARGLWRIRYTGLAADLIHRFT